MTEIRSWAVMLCISLVISSVILFISPEGSLKKYTGYIISVFILTVVLLPVTKMDFSRITEFDPDEFNKTNEEYSFILSEYIYDSGEQVLNDALRNELDKICVDEYTIDVIFSQHDENAIGIEKITIGICQTDIKSISVIRKKVGEMTGVIPEVNIYERQSNG